MRYVRLRYISIRTTFGIRPYKYLNKYFTLNYKYNLAHKWFGV